jgi:hypothetical protein
MPAPFRPITDPGVNGPRPRKSVCRSDPSRGISVGTSMTDRESEPTVEALAALIAHHRRRYYNAEPEISDAEFDALEDRLRQLWRPTTPCLAEVGAPPARRRPRSAELTEDRGPRPRRRGAPPSRPSPDPPRSSGATASTPAATSTLPAYKALFLALRRRDSPARSCSSTSCPPRGMEWPKSASRAADGQPQQGQLRRRAAAPG